MTRPALYAQYEREEAIAFFGTERQAQLFCDGQWIIFTDAAVCLTTLGTSPHASYFQVATRFCWVADKPYAANTNPGYPKSIPTRLIGGNAKGLAIHLFVRNGDSSKYLYIGQLEPSYSLQWPGSRNHGQARFQLSPALPSAIWADLTGFDAGDLDHANVDVALVRLSGPTTAETGSKCFGHLFNIGMAPLDRKTA